MKTLETFCALRIPCTLCPRNSSTRQRELGPSGVNIKDRRYHQETISRFRTSHYDLISKKVVAVTTLPIHKTRDQQPEVPNPTFPKSPVHITHPNQSPPPRLPRADQPCATLDECLTPAHPPPRLVSVPQLYPKLGAPHLRPRSRYTILTSIRVMLTDAKESHHARLHSRCTTVQSNRPGRAGGDAAINASDEPSDAVMR